MLIQSVSVIVLALAVIRVGAQGDDVGSFPKLEDVALFKKVTAQGSVCGEPTRTTYCAAVDSEDGLLKGACSTRYCNQKCPYRNRNKKVPKLDLLGGGPDACVTADYVNVRRRGSQSFRFYNEPRCGMSPGSAPKLGPDGQFTLSVWLKQSPGNGGVIFEKIAGPGRRKRVILTIMVSARGLAMQYLAVDQRNHVEFFKLAIPVNEWFHLAVQVYKRDISIYVDLANGTGEPLLTQKLKEQIQDSNDEFIIRMGHRIRETNETSAELEAFVREFPEFMNSTNQYVGWMQEYWWYPLTLTNREIRETITGTFEEVFVQSNCLCPPGSPRIHPQKKRFCIPNGAPENNSTLMVLRLNSEAHPVAYMLDGDPSTFWVSRPELYMPGGLTVVVDLVNGEYEVFYVTVQFYNSQPKGIAINRNSSVVSRLGEDPYLPWGSFADDCDIRYSTPNNGPIVAPDFANCLSFPEDVAYSNGNVTFSLLTQTRPGTNDFYRTPSLMDFIKATQIQIRFTFHYYTNKASISPKHKYYAVREIQVVGRCNCHGHAASCNMESSPYQCNCLDQSNTEGNMCQRCKPLYNDKEFRMGNDVSAYNCRKCECNNHTNSCHYERQRDPYPDSFFQGGGGVCDNCKHNTAGRHCEECKPKYYRTPEAPLDAPDVCISCRCRRAGVVNQTMGCEKVGGQCLCKSKVMSRRCNVCVEGYYNLNIDNEDGCEACDCHLPGTVNRTIICEQREGQCSCKPNVRGRTCSNCQYTFKNLTDGNPDGCEPCGCNVLGATGQHCNPNNGQCMCRANVEGLICDECTDGNWGLSNTGCRSCDCDEAGTEPNTICDKITGQCVCKANTQGRACNECRDQFYNLDRNNLQGCQSCSCDSRGTVNSSMVCNKTSGDCDCKGNVAGRVCNLCKGNTFGLRESLDMGCEPCNCDPMGTALGLELQPHELVCDSNSGQCACLSSREGRRCDQCSSGFYLPPSNETGCLVCDCHPVGSTSQVCNNITGLCPCKPPETGAGVTGRRCDQCAPTFWSFHNLIGECQPCGCDVAGSDSDECNVITGQCDCKGNVIGKKCDTCRPGSSQLSASNPMGCYSHPEQQAAPTQTRVTSRFVGLSWNPPDHPNGDFLSYKLYRNGELIYNLSDTSPFQSQTYNDSSLLPYTVYDYHIETENIGGSVLSPTLRIRTLAGIPTGIPPLEVSNIRAHQASFRWMKPEVAHGPIETYVLQSVTSSSHETPEVHYRGGETHTIVHSLHAFTNYTFTLRACTSGGCGDSRPVKVLTPEAKPSKQMPPSVVALSNTSLQIAWNPPEEPNGIIRLYELMMRGKRGADGVHRPLQRRIFHDYGAYNPRLSFEPVTSVLDPPESNFTQSGLQPFTEYEFLVSSSNRLGSVESPWTTGRTLEGTPVFMSAPNLQAITSSSVNITWKVPNPVTEVRGIVVMYQIILTRNNTSGNPYAPPTEDVVIFSSGPKILQFIAEGFEPYSSHKISMNLCNSVSCVRSQSSDVRTLPSAPQIQAPPVAEWSAFSMNISWKDPEKVNGPQPQFVLTRSRVAFSDPPTEVSRGVRFPGLSYVRFAPDVLPRDASYTGIELKFRTFEKNCLLFFAGATLSSDGLREEYIALQLREGRVWFLFDAQNSPTAVTTSNDDDRTYNDGAWHRVEVHRFNRDGYLEVDEVFTGSNTSTSTTTVIGQNDGVYIGGLPITYDVGRPDDANEHVVVTRPLIGCIKDVRVQRNTALGDWSNVTWDEALQWHRAYQFWQGCPINLIRPCAHFLGRGFLEVSGDLASFYLNTWSVQFSFRTEYSSGILFHVGKSGSDVIIGTIVKGKVRLDISDGSSHVDVAASAPESSNSSSSSSLCDGNWHKIIMRRTTKRYVVEVDDSLFGSAPIASTLTQPNFNLAGPIYFGGVPRNKAQTLNAVFDDVIPPFGGLLRHIKFDDYDVDFASSVLEANNVNLDGCPTQESNLSSTAHEASGENWSGEAEDVTTTTSTAVKIDQSCLNNSIDVIYTGEGHSYLDNEVGLVPFTLYLYKITSSNNGGDAQSQWMVARTGEGIPQMVAAPFNERSVSGRMIHIEWKRPMYAQGVITNYTITASLLHFGEKNDSNDTIYHSHSFGVTRSFRGDMYEGDITGLSPYTSYSFGLTACTRAGCAESEARTSATTLQEIPSDVASPTSSVNATTMTILWKEPGAPNGIITSYHLYHNSTEIYEGLDTHYVINGLPIFTPQKFQLEACTVVGCNASETVTLFSGQLPPSHMDQPMVTVRGPHTVEIRWLEPAFMNGVFTYYVMYIRDDGIQAPGRVAYNTTEQLLQHVIDDLIAGTTYYVTMAACTEGGCRQSISVPFQTKESVPEEVMPPNVTSPDPYSFMVLWNKPGLPNGVVTLYSLYQNQALIYNSTLPASTIVGGLTPWSRHEFRIQVCTKKGCSYGPAVFHRTQQSPPVGKVALSVTVLGPRSLQARWGIPQRRNGLMMYFVICDGEFYIDPEGGNYQTKRESRVMLNTSASSLWVTVKGLIPFTEYIVKVNATNAAGYVISNMRTVSMPPGSPDGVTKPILTSYSPYSILASWKDPGRNNARGNSLFQLQYRAVLPPEIEQEAFDSATRQRSFKLTNLLPFHQYEFQVIASNAFGSTYSGWTSIYTMQAKPSSLDPPMIYEVDAWTLLVKWTPPSSPNGVIMTYNIYQNGDLRAEVSGNVTSLEADQLTPFTSYEFIVEACTKAGCTPSNASRRFRTSASAPEDLEKPILRSDTPESVYVTWNPPRLSNGILNNYHLERRGNESGVDSDSVLLGVFVPSQALRYLDEGIELKPFTTYQYRVSCSTLGGGITTSSWNSVRTRPGRPGGVLTPKVVVTGPISAYVTWEPPLFKNGPLISYEIVFPEPRILIVNTSVHSSNVSNLVPFTNYQVGIIACTSGGCTESPTTRALTFPDVPRGIDLPIVTPISERTINIQWSPPQFPNGPGIYYELSRKILFQPLKISPSPYLNISQTIYSGLELFYQDRELEKYTTCQYIVSVFNSEGSLSSAGVIATSLAGYPIRSQDLNVAVHNHTAVYLWWEEPSIEDLQGKVHQYILRYNSTKYGGGEIHLSPVITSWRLNNLHPGTSYQFELVVDNGAYNVTSLPVFATTDDGAPHGVRPPVAYPLSPTRLRISWMAPDQPNGQITAYNIILDGNSIPTNHTDASAYVISDLRPYTVYTLKLEVCTVYACAVSNQSTQATTKEALPTGIGPPKLKVVEGKSVEVSWEEPSRHNGVLKRYHLQRRTVVACSKMKVGEEDEGCVYVKCALGESVCGSECFRPIVQVCCAGMLHPVDSTKECCGENYVLARRRPSDVCCGGYFHSYQENHQCCHGKYLQVGSGEMCCKDPREDRVTVGVGDLCCEGVPYFNNSLQICCNGVLKDGYGKSCCGRKIITKDQICCGNAETGTIYDDIDGYRCCGFQYLPRNTTMCCRGNNGYLAHHFEDLTTSGKKCCSSKVISTDELCCNGVGYNPNTEVCADIATALLSDRSLPPSCGTGTVCPSDRTMFAACDRCDMNREKFDCFRSPLLPLTLSASGDDEECTTPYTTLYMGPSNILSFRDDDVTFYHTYQYKLLAENKIGFADGDSARITTPQAAPGGVSTPDWTSEKRDTIMLSWRPPEKPNGAITRYALLRDGLEIWSGMALRHTDKNNIMAYREYQYILKACTRAGCTLSGPVRATSVQGVPESFAPPQVTVTGPTSILIKWFPPGKSNGVIEKYVINETDVGTIHTMTSPSLTNLRYEAVGLDPFTQYSYRVSACTAVGCTRSEEVVSARTNEAVPTGVWSRSALLPLNSTTVELIWSKPRRPNGWINEYRMFRRVLTNHSSGTFDDDVTQALPWELVYEGDDHVTSFINVMNEPGMTAQYKLTAINGAGSGVSGVKEVKLPSEFPDEHPEVTSSPLSSTSVQVDWSFDYKLGINSSRRLSYDVLLQKSSNTFIPRPTISALPLRRGKRSIDEGIRKLIEGDDNDPIVKVIHAGSNQSLAIKDLEPFTQYSIRIRTCSVEWVGGEWKQTNNCNIGSEDDVETDSAPPSDLPNPIAKSTAPTTVVVSWKPPVALNGVITGYRVYRRLAPSPDYSIPYEDLIFFTNSSIFFYIDSGPQLRPFTRYQYQVRVSNTEGETSSGWVEVTTQEDIPEGLNKPILTAVSAFAVRATWKPPLSPNGVITRYRLEYQMKTINPTVVPHTHTAITAPSSEHTATFSGLLPFTTYRVRVVAVNQALKEGHSEWSDVKTLAAPPSELSDLEATAVADGRTLLISWDEPALPNGEIEVYKLYEVGYEDTPVYTGLSHHYRFRRLTPYTSYHLVLEACTGPGLCTKSRPTTFTTAETSPEAQSAPKVTISNATAVVVTWTKPTRANGKVISYQVLRRVAPRAPQSFRWRRKRDTISDPQSDGMLEIPDPQSDGMLEMDERSLLRIRRQSDDVTDDGLVVYEVINPTEDTYNYTDVDLRPFSKYGYKILTSTRAGSVGSDWVYTETHQGPPERLSPPVVLHPSDKNPTSLIVTWGLPERINGELQTFLVERNDSTPLSFSPDQFQFVDTNLQPFTVYSYKVIACTAGGCVTSDTTTRRTYEEIPSYVAPPRVGAFNSTAVEASWKVPEIANGFITSYRLYIDRAMKYEGLGMSAILGGLSPYRLYKVFLEACTNSGCRESNDAEVRTLEAPPTGLSVPELHVTSPRSIEVIWRAPDHSNGVIIRYEVHRNGKLISANDGSTTRYHDFGLEAGTEYYYVITAYNKEGRVRSEPPVAMETTPSAPAGMAPPTATATSSSSIEVGWQTPAKPNGEIVNFTLFVREDAPQMKEKVYDFTGSVFSFHIRGLDFFQEYLFWIRACTERGCATSERISRRTMEAAPANQMMPRVRSAHQTKIAMILTWDPPVHPNGIIRRYIVRKRRIVVTMTSSETSVSETIANVTETFYTDGAVEPYTQYQYQVVAVNGAGEAPSPWSSVSRSGEASPENVPAPKFYDVSARSLHVASGNPGVPNGIVRYYHVFMKESSSSSPPRKVSTTSLQDQTIVDLRPSTSYDVQVQMCTRKTMCTFGPLVQVETKPAPPYGQDPPRLVGIASANASLAWSAPEQLNGVITRYELHYRKSCPPPQQPFPQECFIGPTHLAYYGTHREGRVTGLDPYTAYSFSVTSYNEHGGCESEWKEVETTKAEPTYSKAFSAARNISGIFLQWIGSFKLKSELLRYELFDRRILIYQGVDVTFYLRTTSLQVHEFQAVVHTDTGLAETPIFLYDTTSSGTAVLLLKDSEVDEMQNASVPLHQSFWFILLIACGIMIISVILLAVFMVRRNSSVTSSKNTRRFSDSDVSNAARGIMHLSSLDPFPQDERISHYDIPDEEFAQSREESSNVGHLNHSYSLESLDRNTNQLIVDDTYYNQSMIDVSDDAIQTNQWRAEKPKFGANRVDSGVISDDSDHDEMLVKMPVQLVDTHV